MELPTHPDAEDPPSRSSRPPASRTAGAVVAIVAALFVVLIVLHLAGVVGPGAS